jgi:hypothetical protein
VGWPGTSARRFTLSRLNQMDVRNLIAVAHKHYPMLEKEPVTEFLDIDQASRKAQFLQSAQHSLG